MDYEKLYKKSLERASKLRFQNPFDTVSQMMEHVFPELKESEDERIRKAIVEMILDTPNVECEENYNVRKEDALAWLEKQGNTAKEITCTQEVETGNGNIKALVTQKSPAESLGISPEKYNEILIDAQKKSWDIYDDICRELLTVLHQKIGAILESQDNNQNNEE